MHYKNGREAKNGDKIVVLPEYAGGVPMAGILYDATPGNDYCNGKIAILAATDPGVNLKECLHADDVKALATAALAIGRGSETGPAYLTDDQARKATQALNAFTFTAPDPKPTV